jgi:phosphopantetheinyl transferase
VFKYLKDYRWADMRQMMENNRAGQPIYYLATAPELENVSGQYFNLTHSEKLAAHALDRKVG